MTTRWHEGFGTTAGIRCFFASGRVNLLGAHLDYNGGYVLPCAIDRGTYLMIALRTDGRVRLASLNDDHPHESPLEELDHPADDADHAWVNYPLGVIHFLQERGLEVSGIDILIGGDLPIGAGLSSSASLELVTAYGVTRAFGDETSLEDLVDLCRHAENEFVGVHCGIMDQYASGFGKRDHLLFLDCKTLERQYIPFPGDRVILAVTDSRKKRELVDGRFNERVAQCREALHILSRRLPHVSVLRDVARDELEAHRDALSLPVYKRARHVVTECERILHGVEVAKALDFVSLGAMLTKSHESSRDDYEVSCEELDFLVDQSTTLQGVHGSRLTGAGFGGCVVSVMDTGTEGTFRHEIERRYTARFGIEPTVQFFHAWGGPQEIDLARVPGDA